MVPGCAAVVRGTERLRVLHAQRVIGGGQALGACLVRARARLKVVRLGLHPGPPLVLMQGRAWALSAGVAVLCWGCICVRGRAWACLLGAGGWGCLSSRGRFAEYRVF